MLLSLRDVSLHYGTTVLLDHAELNLDAGERVCILGRNGAGKSTLMKIVAGEVDPDEGNVMRSPGLKIARLVQDVPQDLSGSIYDVVAAGLGEAGEMLARYHDLLATDPENLDELGHVQSRLDALDAWNLDARVQEVLKKTQLDGSGDFAALSGGMKRRVLLAQAIVHEPELLLLDEPTNHLDIDAIAWLEAFLLDYRGALLFITHDRAFLQRLATRILELDRGWLTSWPGDYDNYLRRKEERAHAEAQERAAFDKVLAQEEAWIRQGIEARRTRNEGRVRRLEAMRRDYADRRNVAGQAKMLAQEGDRSGKLVAEVTGISYAWGDQPLIRDFSTTILRGDKVGLIGPNGVGKSTFIKLLLGQIALQSGEVRLGANLQIAYFDQLRGGLDENAPVFECVGDGKDHVEINGARKHVMSYLQDFLFTPDRARQPVRSLSGGERNRLLLARLFSRPSNVLVLDEPTNDLDLETLELLEELLTEYQGTVLLVSHDRAFINAVVTRCIVFDGRGNLEEYVGGYDDWLRQRPAVRPSAPAPSATSTTAPEPAPKAAKPAPSLPKLNQAERKELDQLPRRIEKLETEQAELAEKLGSLIGGDKDQLKKLQQRLAQLQSELDTVFARWEELENRKSASGG